MVEVAEGEAELLVDIFGMMHDADQRAALEERISHMGQDSVLLMQYHTVAAIVRSGIWNALRHGHFAYYSTPVLVAMGRQAWPDCDRRLQYSPRRHPVARIRQGRFPLGRPGPRR